MNNKPGGNRRNAGRKRTATLPKSGPLKELPHVMVGEETLTFLRSLPSLSEYVRQAIAEKRTREKESQQ